MCNQNITKFYEIRKNISFRQVVPDVVYHLKICNIINTVVQFIIYTIVQLHNLDFNCRWWDKIANNIKYIFIYVLYIHQMLDTLELFYYFQMCA